MTATEPEQDKEPEPTPEPDTEPVHGTTPDDEGEPL